MLIGRVLPLSFYRKKPDNLFHLNCGVPNFIKIALGNITKNFMVSFFLDTVYSYRTIVRIYVHFVFMY